MNGIGRAVFAAVLALFSCGCQRNYEVFGSVVEAGSSANVADAELFIADRIIDADMDNFLKAPSAVRPKTGAVGKTSTSGQFRSTIPVFGPGGHSVWIVVVKPGYFEHHEEVWTGVGYPDPRTLPLLVRIKPMANTP